jgi:hypothetical protein
MLIDLLIKASSAVPDSGFARLLRRIDRSLLLTAEVDARTQSAAGGPMTADQVVLARRFSQPSSLPSMTTRPEAITSPPAI